MILKCGVIYTNCIIYKASTYLAYVIHQQATYFTNTFIFLLAKPRIQLFSREITSTPEVILHEFITVASTVLL